MANELNLDELKRLVAAHPEKWKTDEAEHDQPYLNIKILSENGNKITEIWIDDSPDRDFNSEQTAKAHLIVALHNAAPALIAEVERLRAALVWVMGGPGSDFRTRRDGEGAYYWRKELAERAGMKWNQEKLDYDFNAIAAKERENG